MMNGTQYVSRGPLYQKCVANPMEQQKRELFERIRDIRAKARRIEIIAPSDTATQEEVIKKIKEAKKKQETVEKLDTFTGFKEINGTQTLRFIIRAVSAHFDIPVADLKSHKRKAYICYARHVAFWLAYRMTTKSLPEIGAAFGGRDHTTILHGVKNIEKRYRDREGKACSDIHSLRVAFAYEAGPELLYWGA